MLTVTDLTVSRGGHTLFEGASLSLAPGHRLGVTGPNGCGKSSLFAVLAGELEADHGEVEVPADWRIVQIQQESPSSDDKAIDFVLSADAELDRLNRALESAEKNDDHHLLAKLHHDFEAVDGHSAPARCARLLAGLGFSEADQQRPVESFSGGWRGRLALARALFQPSELLLLDEPTNHLDLETIIWLERWLRRYPGVVLVVSHDQEFLDRVTTHTAWYEHGRLRMLPGSFGEVEEKRAQALDQQAAEYRKQQSRARELKAFVDRFRYKATKARQAQSRLKMLERLTATAPIHAADGYRFEFPAAAKTSSPLVGLDGVAVGYDGRPVLSEMSLSLLPGDRIGLLGRNGAGKSTFIRLLSGALEPLAGEIRPGRHFEAGYYAQHQVDQLDYASSPLEHLRRLAGDTPEQRLRDFLGGYGFHGDAALEPVAPRSGGEKARLALALLAWKRPNLLILDEPTNHLDMETRRALAEALQAFEGALVLVSHDRSLLTACCDEFLLIHDGRVEPFDGDLDDYARGLFDNGSGRNRESPGRDTRAPQPRERRKQAARDRERLKPLRNRLTRLERKMDEAREALDAAREALADPALYAGGERGTEITDLQRNAAEAQQALEDLEREWLQVGEELEARSADPSSD